MTGGNVEASQKAIDLIKQFEGCMLDTYLCPAGIPTIGYGHTGGVRMGVHITPAMADQLLREDVEKFAHGVDAWVDADITQHQFDALVCFAFNVGLSALRSSTLLRKVEACDTAGAAEEFLKWNKAKHNGVMVPLEGLTKRRQAERALFLT